MTIKIVDTIARRGLCPSGDYVLIGLVLSNGRTVWGHCIHLAYTSSTIQVIEQQIKPILQEQPIDSWQVLIAQIDAFLESVTTTHIIQPDPESSASGVTMSRRHLISGFLAKDKPQTKVVTEERPYHSALRFGVSQALYEAVALCANKTLFTVLSEYWGYWGYCHCRKRPSPCWLLPLNLI